MPLYSNVFSLYREWPGVLSVQLKRNRLPVKVQPDAVLQAEIEKAVSQTVKVQLLTGSTTARSSAVSCGCRPPLDSGGRSAIILIKFAPCLLTGGIAAAPFGRRGPRGGGDAAGPRRPVG